MTTIAHRMLKKAWDQEKLFALKQQIQVSYSKAVFFNGVVTIR